ncbi:MAG: isoleucine--tRNA ligase [Thermodesulfovibrionales bacterium]|nr:isoleucine--tRNA ligase [Thermodesulfovibrionales bacterium]
MPIDYKDTLNLPETAFPMKANLNQKEPEILRFWEEKGIYEKIQQKNKTNEPFILHDGPPYANGNIHIGHALNKILKDIIVKYKSMKGFYSPYVPGWDCHGLPIELQVDKTLGDKKDSIDKIKKRQLCREYADRFVSIQREDFKRLGVFGDWQRPYLTMSYEYESAITKEFFIFVKKGLVYKGKKPVHWCPSCITALAEAEVEYNDKESPSIYVAFRLDTENSKFPSLKDKVVSIAIWTTTPWTLPANLALAVNPEEDYILLKSDKGLFVIARENLKPLSEKQILSGEVIDEFKGRVLDGMTAHHPFIKRQSIIVCGEFVTVGEGTGIVHIAPGHGEDDYEVGLTHNLDIYAPVDDKGRFTDAVEDFKGQFVFKANDGIIELLKSNGALLGAEKITHSYPHCWRCKKPVIFRATAQWFISMDKGNLRDASLKEIERVIWLPSWGKERISNMVKNRPDWCISRQRAWGVPITLLTCSRCGNYIYDEHLFDRIVSLFEKEGADAWYHYEIEDLIGSDYICKHCGNTVFVKEMDILDVWFDSGVSHAAVLERDKRLKWPAEMYLEGSDQHRGWFQSSLLASVGTRDTAPYKIVLTHGFTVDGQGKKMSKSLGNVIAPQEVIKANGAEILRLWVSAEDYQEDVRLSKEIINRLTEAYRKIRNTGRYLLGNLNDFDNGDYSKNLLEIDRWAMSRLHQLIKKVNNSYERYSFHEIYHSIYNFCVSDMSAFYLDILKDRLYTFKKDSLERRAAQWVLYQILINITKLIAPILSFTAEEMWSYIKDKDCESVFLSDFPVADVSFIDQEIEDKWQRLITIRDDVNKALELKRKEKFIGNSLEAKVRVYCNEKEFTLLFDRHDFLRYLFIVSQVEIYKGILPPSDAIRSNSIEDLYVYVTKADGLKCERCWNYSTFVGSFKDYPEICERCYPAISG